MAYSYGLIKEVVKQKVNQLCFTLLNSDFMVPEHDAPCRTHRVEGQTEAKIQLE